MMVNRPHRRVDNPEAEKRASRGSLAENQVGDDAAPAVARATRLPLPSDINFPIVKRNDDRAIESCRWSACKTMG